MAAYKYAFMGIEKFRLSMFQSLTSRGHVGCVAVLHCGQTQPVLGDA